MAKTKKVLSEAAVLELQNGYYFFRDWAFLSDAVVLAEVKKIASGSAVPTTRPGQMSLLAQHYGVKP